MRSQISDLNSIRIYRETSKMKRRRIVYIRKCIGNLVSDDKSTVCLLGQDIQANGKALFLADFVMLRK